MSFINLCRVEAVLDGLLWAQEYRTDSMIMKTPPKTSKIKWLKMSFYTIVLCTLYLWRAQNWCACVHFHKHAHYFCFAQVLAVSVFLSRVRQIVVTEKKKVGVKRSCLHSWVKYTDDFCVGVDSGVLLMLELAATALSKRATYKPTWGQAAGTWTFNLELRFAVNTMRGTQKRKYPKMHKHALTVWEEPQWFIIAAFSLAWECYQCLHHIGLGCCIIS